MLQCLAVRCVSCATICIAARCDLLQFANDCSVLTNLNFVHVTKHFFNDIIESGAGLQRTATHCNALQRQPDLANASRAGA